MITLSNTVTAKVKKVLDFLSLRSSLISSNIANVDTPGYKAVDVKFSDQLTSSLDEGDQFSMSTTHRRHIGESSSTMTTDVDPEIIFSPTREMRMDGNNVDIDKEMVKLAENQIMYSALVQSISKKLNGLRYTIEEGKRG